MKFTFGVITTDESNPQVRRIVDSIRNIYLLHKDDYEIIIVGGKNHIKERDLTIIPFDEQVRRAWITKKKNVITSLAKYENIVYMHDYICPSSNWRAGFEVFGDKFDVCMTPIINTDGTRYRDWSLWWDDDSLLAKHYDRLIPYTVTDMSKSMYFSGAYWVAKRGVMEAVPLDESLSWGQSEDVVWSKQVRENHQFSINVHSPVDMLKYKNRVYTEISPAKLQKIRSLSDRAK